jgi:hypothetical protein
MTKAMSRMRGWGGCLLTGALLTLALPAGAQDDGEMPPTLDEEFAQLAEELPGFGGLYLDERGTTHVYLQDLAWTEAAQRLGETVEVHQGQYDFRDLFAWKEVLLSQLARDGVVMMDIDEGRNRLLFGVEADAVDAFRTQLEGFLRDAGIPAAAVLIEPAEPVVLQEALRDTIRPVPGGVQIQRLSNCTLGVNAVRNGVQGFVTAAHCTSTIGAVNGSIFSQSFVPFVGFPPVPDFLTNRVGVETVDPPTFTVAPCPIGLICRNSDAAFVAYDSASLAEQGQIANPLLCNFQDPGIPGLALEVNPAVPRLQITAAPLSNVKMGTLVHKVGRTTGCTKGTVIGTCQNIQMAGANIRLLCQNQVAALSSPGDSGSPVFVKSSDEATLVGILWGANFAGYLYSPWLGVRADLGSLNVLTP